MPPDRSVRPLHSNPSNSGFSTSALHQPYNTRRPHRLAAGNTPVSPTDHAAVQSSAATIPPTPTPGYEHWVTSPPPLVERSHGTLAANNVPSDLYPLNDRRLQSHLPTPQYYEERYPIHQSFRRERDNLMYPQATPPHFDAAISHQYTQPYPTQSVNPFYPVGPQYHTINRGHHPPASYPQVENTLHLRTPFEQQCSSSQPPPHNSKDMFYQAHDFVINDSIFIDSSSDNFMASFLKETILGAEFDSSDHNMPLRCHPGTRLKIIKRCQDFVLDRDGRPKIRWVVGAAGVGKSAIMQSIAHDDSNVLSDIIMGATIFFSVNGRDDGTKAITTIAYQLAVRLGSYHRFVQHEITRDPSLFQKSLSRQFKKFIVEPFIHQRILDGSSQLLIIIDGLDECADSSMQRKLLGLVTDFCIAYPTSPIVWMIASRPEPHITSFFSHPKVAFSYEKEEILVDSDEARDDVKSYLRDKLREVQLTSITLQQLAQWPSEADLLKIANASGGLFAYASTVVRYIDDPDYGDPISLLNDVLEIIETGTKKNTWGRNHPMAQLDALYSHIMSKIPANVMVHTRKLLLTTCAWKFTPFQLQCNMLGITQNAAYGATHHIHSIAFVPEPAVAESGYFEFYHKSFVDYLHDFERSGFSTNIRSEANQLASQCTLRIFKEAPDSIYVHSADDTNEDFESFAFKNYAETGDNISVSWPAIDRMMQLDMFGEALLNAMRGLEKGEEAFQDLFCIRVLTTSFTHLHRDFPMNLMKDIVFDQSRRLELLEHGIIKQVPLETIDFDMIKASRYIQLRFRGPTVGRPNPWNGHCRHEREGSWEGDSQDWSTMFQLGTKYDNMSRHSCLHCFERFTDHLKARVAMGDLVPFIDFTPTLRCVELRFVDPEDGMSDWIYRFSVKKDKQSCL